jgi:hypothetical protein
VPAHRGIGLFLVALVAGLVIGSLLGDLLGQLVGSPWLRDLLTRGPTIGLTPPVTLDLRLVSITFGATFKVNVVGVIGIVVALLLVRRV